MLQVQLHPTQYEVATDPHRFRVISAGRRWGKSVLGRLCILQWALQTPGIYWIVSPTYRQGKQNHWLELKKEIPKEWVSKWNEVELSVTLITGSVIELKGAENPDALRGARVRGLVIDEIASIRNWHWLWQEVLRPTLTDYEAPAIFISTPKGFNHFHELFLLGQSTSSTGSEDSLYRSWRFTSYDNPYIPKQEIDQAKKELTDDTFAQEYMADFRKYVGLVYKEFNRETHVKELPDFQPVFYIRGLDRGFRNPTAVPIIGVDADGIWYQDQELHQVGLTNPSLNQELALLGGERVFELSTMDSAQASDIQELNDLGQDFLPVKKESGEAGVSYVRYKIQKLAQRLKVGEDGQPGYYVHPSCTKTIEEFETYSYPERIDDTKAQDENPIKVNDHMMDALGDLNAMYIHLYEVKEKKPWEGKIPGTFIPPSPGGDEDNDPAWTEDRPDPYWENAA